MLKHNILYFHPQFVRTISVEMWIVCMKLSLYASVTIFSHLVQLALAFHNVERLLIRNCYFLLEESSRSKINSYNMFVCSEVIFVCMA